MRKIAVLIFIVISSRMYAQEKGVFVDSRDGIEYKWVKIGQQVWMAENLAYLPAVYSPFEERVQPQNGRELDVKILESSFQFVYGYDGTDITEAKSHYNYEKNGVLYNYTSATKSCPDGWHLPSDKEWMELEEFIGMEKSEIEVMKFVRGDIADKLRSREFWGDQVKAMDDFGFSILPGGTLYISPNHNNGAKFLRIGQAAYYWSSTEYNHAIIGNIQGVMRSIECYKSLEFDVANNSIGRYPTSKWYGLSVRCIKN
ncbi:MAG: hypothetical protein JEZ14_14165 [Marinilabiliaceae bacterium]|nr:hypothetical protein [Marinilabiliaceae bacterium]